MANVGRTIGWGVMVMVVVGQGRLMADEKARVAGRADVSKQVLRKSVRVKAPVGEVWKAWTTADGVKSFFAPEANIELTPGGAYEIYFDPSQPYGMRGSEGCTVLGFLPHELLAFSWNAPPTIPKLREAGERTQVIIELVEVGPGDTTVRLTQFGFGEGEDWVKYHDYFDMAWDRVLSKLAANINSGSGEPLRPDNTWRDANVSVSSFSSPVRRQDFDVLIPAGVADVWRSLTTPEGVKTYLPTNPIIELEVGGKWDLFGGKPNTILSFVPNELLIATGSAPEQFPIVKQGGHWGVFRFDAINPETTRLRLSVVGWKSGEEWDQAYDYFLKANAAFLNMIHRRFTEGPLIAKE